LLFVLVLMVGSVWVGVCFDRLMPTSFTNRFLPNQLLNESSSFDRSKSQVAALEADLATTRRESEQRLDALRTKIAALNNRLEKLEAGNERSGRSQIQELLPNQTRPNSVIEQDELTPRRRD